MLIIKKINIGLFVIICFFLVLGSQKIENELQVNRQRQKRSLKKGLEGILYLTEYLITASFILKLRFLI